MHSLKCSSRSIHPLGDRLGAVTLASGAIVNNLMRKKITVNAEVVLTGHALVATADTHAFSMILRYRPLILWWYRWEGQSTSKAGGARGTAPGYLHPVHQGEQVVVGARKVG